MTRIASNTTTTIILKTKLTTAAPEIAKFNYLNLKNHKMISMTLIRNRYGIAAIDPAAGAPTETLPITLTGGAILWDWAPAPCKPVLGLTYTT